MAPTEHVTEHAQHHTERPNARDLQTYDDDDDDNDDACPAGIRDTTWPV